MPEAAGSTNLYIENRLAATSKGARSEPPHHTSRKMNQVANSSATANQTRGRNFIAKQLVCRGISGQVKLPCATADSRMRSKRGGDGPSPLRKNPDGRLLGTSCPHPFLESAVFPAPPGSFFCFLPGS